MLALPQPVYWPDISPTSPCVEFVGHGPSIWLTVEEAEAIAAMPACIETDKAKQRRLRAMLQFLTLAVSSVRSGRAQEVRAYYTRRQLRQLFLTWARWAYIAQPRTPGAQRLNDWLETALVHLDRHGVAEWRRAALLLLLWCWSLLACIIWLIWYTLIR